MIAFSTVIKIKTFPMVVRWTLHMIVHYDVSISHRAGTPLLLVG